MKLIVAPITRESRGETVLNLQEALLFLIQKKAIQPPEREGPPLNEKLMRERREGNYGERTVEAVRLFQNQHTLPTSGEVDARTAETLNKLLQKLGGFVEPPPDRERAVSGRIMREGERPFQGGLVRAFHETEPRAIRLGEGITDVEGHYTIPYKLPPGVDSINLRVTVFDVDGKSLCDSAIIRGAKPVEVVDLSVPGVEAKTYQVEGKVASRVSAGIGGLRVLIVDKGVGGDVQLAQAATNESGAYRSTFSDGEVSRRGKAQPDLQARVYAGDIFLGASDVHYNASQNETLNVLLDDKVVTALQSEHEVLTSAISEHFKGKLSELKETDDQQDITYLANKTGWDARAVALAALSDQFSARTVDASGVPAIPQSFFYALFRAGLPANEETLYHTDAKTLEDVWKKATEQGVISKTSVEQIPNLIRRFQALSAQKLLSGPALVGPSPLKEMLTISNLNGDQQVRFAQLYAANLADMPAFWKAVGEDQVFGATSAERAKTVTRLQVDGKLGFLTINNALLMQKVHAMAGHNGLSDPLQLAQMGYHRAEPWSQLLTEDVPIPKEIPGDAKTVRGNYAEYLAAQVRLSYPTASVAEMIKSGALPLIGAADETADLVHAFLTQHQGKFEIGVEPVEQYLKRNNIEVTQALEKIVSPVKCVQRVYQITPSDQAMIGLMKRGIDAAYHVVRYDKDTFLKSFAVDLGGQDQAALVYDRSVQVHNVVLNVALSYLHARTAPAIGVHSPAGILDPTPANVGDVIPYATLETLFDSMDFCACDHCRSILSPAAYLVDLLQFLYSDNDVWKAFTTNWKNKYNCEYPFTDAVKWQNANQPPAERSPFEVLMSRRPDIQHIPLTCENTNTALPYIDVVNETLEYYVANGLTLKKNTLEEYLGHDTDGAASEDLLASPQSFNETVRDDAYSILREKISFPPPLPFHQPLENLRRYFNKFEIPLPLAMERLRKSDDLDRGINPYGWRDILMEEINVSRAEYAILTTSNATTDELLWQIYGYPEGTKDADIINGNQAANIPALSNAKQFCRWLGISYEDLVSILKTRFINPNSFLIPKLERLGVSFATLDELHKTPQRITDDGFNKLLPTGASAIDIAVFGGKEADLEERKNLGHEVYNYAKIIRAWLKANEDDIYNRIMRLITLAIPADKWNAGKEYAVGDCVLPAKSETNVYYECTTAGRSDGSGPTGWTTTPGETVNDRTVVWTCRNTSSCHSFDNLTFRYSNPAKLMQNISATEFVRLVRFIRLWKKLGWTIEQTDAAICALYREDLSPFNASDIDDVDNPNNGFLRLLPRLGIVKRVMEMLNLTPKRDLLPLLACFGPISTHDGAEWFVDKDQSRKLRLIPSLYRQLFLNPALLEQDKAFADNGYGEFLTNPADKLADHAEALRSAFNLTAQEFSIIAEDLQFKVILEAPYTHSQPTLEQAIVDAAPGISYDDQNKKLFYPGTLDNTRRDELKTVIGVSQQFKDAVDALYAEDSTLTPLHISNVSVIFRRGWLSRKLKLSVRELLLLSKLTGLDPFSEPDIASQPASPAPPIPAKPPILRLIDLVQALRDRSLKSEAALYLIWDQDLSGKSAPDPAQIKAFAQTLRQSLASVETEFAVADDPDGSITRTRMTLVYGDDATALFFGFLDNTFVSSVQYDRAAIDFVTQIDYTHNNPALEQEILDAAPKQIAYDNIKKKLIFTGVMADSVRIALKKITGVTNDFKNAVDALYNENQIVVNANLWQPVVDIAPDRIRYDDFQKRLSFDGILKDKILNDIINEKVNGAPLPQEFKDALQKLYKENQRIVELFFARYSELQSLYDNYASDTTNSVSEKRTNLLKAILPELVERRKRQQALQSVSALVNADLAFTQAFLDPPPAPFPLHAADDTKKQALNDLLAVETTGLSVQFFANETATGPLITEPGIPDIDSKLDYSPKVNSLPANTTAGAAISVVWRGYLEAPESGFFNLRIMTDADATVKLQLLDDKRRPVNLFKDPTDAKLWRNTDPIELHAGTLYSVRLTVEKVRDVVCVQWEWEPKGQGRVVIPARYLYPETVFNAFQKTYIRFLKAASMANGLGLTAKELEYFATHDDYKINNDGWLNQLSVIGDPSQATATALLKPFEALLDFARIKAETSPSDESLLTALKDPSAATQSADSLLFTITRWNKTSLNDILAHFNSNIAGLGHFDMFRRVYDAFALTRQMRISAKSLIQATTNEPNSTTVRDLQAALRARYDAVDWRDVVRPINDEMRSLQRDALVAYILHQMRSHPESVHIDTPDKLFEYFLMDVQMDPCMQTSRIRHALSSVQLFIERCLMNLEPRVSPAVTNATQWEWMKRYRVWEANRKVYLFPENWLEPELRDDQSPFFKETMSELLQGDITEDRAAVALLNYLSKLEEVAKLEPCGIHHVPRDDAKRTPEINHVVARTAGAHRKYFYRRCEGGSWTPWEQIKLDIEDNPVIPVVWNDRLFLFWLRILKKGPDTAQKPFSKEGDLTSLKTSDITTDPPHLTVQAVLCWSEYYNGKWQATRTSDVAHPLKIDDFEPQAFDRSKVKLSALFFTKGALRIIISYDTGFGTSFFLHNAFSTPELRTGKKEPHFSPKRTLETTTDNLEISYSDSNITNLVLSNAISDHALQPNHPVEGNAWGPPFFYDDARHVFYVTTSEKLVWIPQWNGFIISESPPKVTPNIPPLIFEPAKIVPDPVGPIIKQPGFGVIHPSPIERYVTEDAYVHRVIGTLGTVQYGNKEIGLAGSQVKSIRTR